MTVLVPGGSLLYRDPVYPFPFNPDLETHSVSGNPPVDRAQTVERRIALVTVITPFLAVIGSIFLFWGHGIGWIDLLAFAGMYIFTGLGVILGFHRFFTHRSFKCVLPMKYLLGIAGCMAAEGPIYFWVACHRRHHQCSDSEGDPHSPHMEEGGLWASIKGAWHAHAGWMFNHAAENYRRLVPDLLRDKDVAFIDRHYFYWLALGLLVPAFAVMAVTQTWWGFLHGLFWGGFIRIFFVHHSTWSVNSICHLFGSSPFATRDESRNNFFCALFTFGEGWHNNHHAFPASSRHGLLWWQFDSGYLLIKALSFLGLTWDLIEPGSEQIEAALRKKAALATEVPEVLPSAEKFTA